MEILIETENKTWVVKRKFISYYKIKIFVERHTTMFAIEINPNSRTVKRLKFEPHEDWSENIYELLGTWEWRHLCQFDNMDVMYTDRNGIKHENCGFLLCESGEVIFGKAIFFGICSGRRFSHQ